MERDVPNYWRDIKNPVRPAIIGTGAEHTIFSRLVPGEYVAKVNRMLVEGYLEGSLGTKDLELEIVRHKQRQAILRESFGEKHTLPEYLEVMDVRLSSQEIAGIVTGPLVIQEGSSYSFPTVVLFQKVVPELEDDYGRKMRKIISLGDSKYAEERFDPQDQRALALYETASDYLIFGKGNLFHLARNDHAGLWAPSTWREFNSDDWISPAMHEFATGITTYRQNTRVFGDGEVLDTIGPNNIIFYPKTPDQTADFTLIDALYPFFKYPSLIMPLTIERIRRLLLKANQDTMPEFTSSEKAQVMNGVNYLRHVNAIIEFSNSEVLPLHIFEGNTSWRPDIWRRVYTMSRELLFERGRVDSVPNIL